MISKMILSSNQLGCSEEIITIAAILSVQVSVCIKIYFLAYCSQFLDSFFFIIWWKVFSIISHSCL